MRVTESRLRCVCNRNITASLRTELSGDACVSATGKGMSCRAASGAVVAASMLSTAFSHVAHAEKRDFRIERPELPAALMEFGRQASAQLLFEADAVSGQRARPVSGRYEPIDALRLMLKGTQLRAEERAGGVLII